MISNTLTMMFLVFITTCSFAKEYPSELEVVVTGAVANKGQVILSIFGSKSDYLKNPVKSETANVNKDGKVIFALKDIQKGRIAISAVYDENQNGLLDTNFLGIPIEPVGFSKNVSSLFGPPSFDDVAVEFEASMKVFINLEQIK